MIELFFFLIKLRSLVSRAKIEDEKMDKLFALREVVDPVWLMKEYKPQVYPIEDAVRFHLELAQTNMLNNLDGFLHARLVLDMTTKKKVRLSVICRVLKLATKFRARDSTFFTHFPFPCLEDNLLILNNWQNRLKKGD